jgi:hypothetical protein
MPGTSHNYWDHYEEHVRWLVGQFDRLPLWDGKLETAWREWFAHLDAALLRKQISRRALAAKTHWSHEKVAQLFRDTKPADNWFRWKDALLVVAELDIPAKSVPRWQKMHAAAEQFWKSADPLPPPRPTVQVPGSTAVVASSPRARPVRRRRLVAMSLITASALAAVGGIAAGLSGLGSEPGGCSTGATAQRTVLFPGDYAGPVHVTVCPAGRSAANYRLILVWGPWRRTVTLTRVSPQGSTVAFGKAIAGNSYPLTIMVSPAARLGYGTGAPVNAVDIDAGWTHQPAKATG